MTSARVRSATVADLDAVSALEAESLGADAWSPGLLAEVLAGAVPTVEARVAELDGEVVGWAAVSAVEDVSELQRLAVQPAQRRRGLAAALVAEAVRAAGGAGGTRLLLEVREDNLGARAFYAHTGFGQVARRPRYYRDGAAAVILERPVLLDG